MGIDFSETLRKMRGTATATKSEPQPQTKDSGGNGSAEAKSSATNTNEHTQSVFNESENASQETKSVQKNANQTQEQIIAKLKAAGLKTTKIHYEKGETDFAQYMAAIDDELKKEIVDSYDCEADYILQQEVLGMFKDKHIYDTKVFKEKLKSMGYNISVKNYKTGLLTDWKKDVGSKYERHTIQLITIQDPKTGAEIKVADTNGNGQIEIEEVVANEFLTGIAASIDTSNLAKAGSSAASIPGLSTDSEYISTISNGSAGNSSAQKTQANQQTRNGEGKIVLNEKQYTMLKEKIANFYVDNKNYDKSTAEMKASLYVQERCTISSEAKSISNLESLALSMVK